MPNHFGLDLAKESLMQGSCQVDMAQVLHEEEWHSSCIGDLAQNLQKKNKHQ
jgi:hypothetical protein